LAVVVNGNNSSQWEYNDEEAYINMGIGATPTPSNGVISVSPLLLEGRTGFLNVSGLTAGETLINARVGGYNGLLIEKKLGVHVFNNYTLKVKCARVYFNTMTPVPSMTPVAFATPKWTDGQIADMFAKANEVWGTYYGVNVEMEGEIGSINVDKDASMLEYVTSNVDWDHIAEHKNTNYINVYFVGPSIWSVEHQIVAGGLSEAGGNMLLLGNNSSYPTTFSHELGHILNVQPADYYSNDEIMGYPEYYNAPNCGVRYGQGRDANTSARNIASPSPTPN